MRAVADLLPGREMVAVATPDGCSRLIGKRRPISDWPALVADGLTMPDFHLVTGLPNVPVKGLEAGGEATGFRNGVLMPDPSAGFVSPAEPATVYVMAQARCPDGSPAEVAPRTVLERQLKRLKAIGLSAKMAFELEFYAFRQPYEELARIGHDSAEPLWHRHGDNDLLVSGHLNKLFETIDMALAEGGIAVSQMQGEGGPGQCELNLCPADPMTAADQHVAFKHIVKAACGHMGHAATFLARPLAEEAGSGGHVHVSLRDACGANALADGEGLSTKGRAFIAGILAYAPDLTLLSAPYVNSYRRLQPGTYAPLTATWAFEERLAMLRVIDAGDTMRLEFRLPGADASPYLVAAGLFAAGLAGIEADLPLPEPGLGDPLPGDLTEAIATYEMSAFAKRAFGDAAHANILGLACAERDAFRQEISAWEIARGFETA